MAKKPTYEELVKKVSELKKEAAKNRRLLKQLRLYALAFDHIYDGIVLTDFEGKVIDWNPAAERMFGYSKKEMLGKTTALIHRPEEAAALSDTIMKETKAKGIWIGEINFVRKDGTEGVCETIVVPLLDEDGRPVSTIGVNHDISERKLMEEELRQLATTDSLTGANNRYCFLERAQEEFSRAIRYERKLSVLMIDIDMFKRVNDTYGHQFGDRILKTLVKESLKILRQTDIFGRIGGEEFSAMLVETDMKMALNVAERLRKHVEKLKVKNEHEKVSFTISIGATCVEKGDTLFEEVFNRADKALYEAKNKGRNRVCHG